MGDTRTLQNLIDDCAARADTVITTTSFVTQAQATTWINQFIGKMRSRVIQEFDEDYYTITGPNSSTSLNVDAYPLPTDFFKLLGVDYSVDSGANWRTAHRLNFADRNRFGSSSSWPNSSRPRYKLFGTNLMLRPVPSSVYLYRLVYAPTLTRLVNLSDTFEFYDGWDRFIGASVAVLMLGKEESSVTTQKNEALEAWADICADVRVRDAGEPGRVQDSMGFAIGSRRFAFNEDDFE